MQFKLINVGIADLKVVSTPNILRTILGSCIGICLYDPSAKIAGLAHIMLPSVNASREANHRKYADSAIPILVEEMQKGGARRDRLIAKITGGATMLKMMRESMMSEIGRNNAAKVREVLKEMNIPIVAENVGGDYGRTIDFFAETGMVKIKSIDRPEIDL
ncbi:MAG TPA: chemotaxis protein CheD [Spirochaetota bacterium]|nr:chemotaxis protein CheD [Spirochaetota bacterium]HNT12023.1 chemotaxis protein CheD [Spirochaetota bacterium]HNV47832.1 chemotaxis protein CheD [Spirochaetota bacterium]HOS40027.1 chemotaxis protein CheD [Spirochaetota bacterium]HPU88013.1 chemotaxis protein CheD [Spirochaetota bacterium]